MGFLLNRKNRRDCNKIIGQAMKKYIKAQRAGDKEEMHKRELIILACGGTLEQAEHPSPWLLLRIGTDARQRWQRKRDEAQAELFS